MSAKKPSKATRAIGYAVEAGAQLWHNQDSEAYVDVRGEHGERISLRVRSRACRTWLSGLMFASEGEALGGQAATDAVDVLTAMAVHEGQERSVHVRLAEHDGDLYLDLGDATWRAVHISADGWELVSEPPVRFRRPRGLRPLPEPVQTRGKGWDALHDVLHQPADQDWILLVSWLVGALHPSGPYPILALTGEQGSAKTTVGRLLRSMVDPSEAPLRSPPRDDRELVIAARNSHIVGLDNLSRIYEWLSDALCRIATGGGYSARQLYTDGEEVIYADRRPIILTSIEDVATRGDLADRTVAVTLPRIPEQARKPEREIYSIVNGIQPKVLGDLLDAVSLGLQRRDLVHLDRMPRMADFAEWIVACEPALPWKDGKFMKSYDSAREEMVQTGIEADAVATAIVQMLRDIGSWSGTATEILAELNKRQNHGNGRGEKKPPKYWPETPQAMGGRLTRVSPLLRSAGWDIRKGEGRGRYTIYITPNEHSTAKDAHDAHDANGARNHGGSGREHSGEHSDDGARTAHGTAHAENPRGVRDVSTREHGEHSPHTCTNPSSDDDPLEVMQEASDDVESPTESSGPLCDCGQPIGPTATMCARCQAEEVV